MNKNKWLVNLFAGFVKLTGLLPAWLFLKPKVHLAPGAKRKLPKSCILVSNHISLLDFVLYLLVFPGRTLRFLIAEVLYNRSKLLALFLNLVGGIRVDRNAKTFDFVSHALDVLDNNGVVGVFPQGRLPLKGQQFPFTVSTAFIAMHTQAPIVPVYTDGHYGITKRANLVIGEPIYLQEFAKEGLSEQEQLAHLTKILEETVFKLKEELKS
ncbi:MAG: 1-acyl-sn-glycerol-3-phosphate acyltransferase [Oscillospiraceae bacterium]|nr:1-acyl-sn-glycerol-3-phosphate acyltransferase [Oscillospiraceae bacterium]